MKPIVPNPREELKQIRTAISELTKVVSEIKSMLMKDVDEKKSN
tara:strand:+ start:109 stop:240 length:132 start_codon:yes stop_codon:yes gene_type:complete